jgi:DNA-binding GntR family transcriptional regulator
VNKQERTYTILRDRIHAGTYQPLARLNIDALAREFEVSAIPVREALRRLEAEGWVQFKPNVGAVVAPVDSTSWEKAMVTLAILEGAATAEAQRRMRRTDFARLRKLSTEMRTLTNDPLRFSAANRALHDIIVARCDNECLLDVLKLTYVRLDRVRQTMFVYLSQRSENALHEHDQLIELLEHGDRDEVERYARWHKLQTVEAYRAIHQANDEARATGGTRTNRARSEP